MNRNSESHFSNLPDVNISRSKFDRSFTHKTTFNTGDLIPIFCDTTIMPGDTVKMRMSEVVRMATPITPVMDNANLDLYFFFVPNRLVWTHFKRFMGENDTAPWVQQTEYEIPQVTFPWGSYGGQTPGWSKGDIADYLGYPTEIGATEQSKANYYTASALPFRAYSLIWNEFFRDQNLQNPVNVFADDDTTRWGVSGQYNSYNIVTQTSLGGRPLKANKYHDYFTSCLPGPQKGPSITIPLGEKAPIMWGDQHWIDPQTSENKWSPLGLAYGKEAAFNPVDIETEEATVSLTKSGYVSPLTGQVTELWQGVEDYSKLYTDLSQATGATINQLRQAFAIQKFYERQALGGTRYIEMVKAHFNVTNPDFRLQRPEYLGGKRIPININQVVQNTPTDGNTTPLGATGAYSLTADRDDMFTHSFTEHGILMGLAVVRTVHTYQQGLNRQYSKKKFTDFYFPEFANLGNQAVLNKEIYYSTDEKENEEAFGYQEAWATERYFPDIVTGEMRSNYAQSLDIWHWGDYYTSRPTLGDKWISETEENVERTLAVQDQDQFIADFYFGAIYTRPMPLYSIPGLIDHH